MLFVKKYSYNHQGMGLSNLYKPMKTHARKGNKPKPIKMQSPMVLMEGILGMSNPEKARKKYTHHVIQEIGTPQKISTNMISRPDMLG